MQRPQTCPLAAGSWQRGHACGGMRASSWTQGSHTASALLSPQKKHGCGRARATMRCNVARAALMARGCNDVTSGTCAPAIVSVFAP